MSGFKCAAMLAVLAVAMAMPASQGTASGLPTEASHPLSNSDASESDPLPAHQTRHLSVPTRKAAARDAQTLQINDWLRKTLNLPRTAPAQEARINLLVNLIRYGPKLKLGHKQATRLRQMVSLRQCAVKKGAGPGLQAGRAGTGASGLGTAAGAGSKPGGGAAGASKSGAEAATARAKAATPGQRRA